MVQVDRLRLGITQILLLDGSVVLIATFPRRLMGESVLVSIRIEFTSPRQVFCNAVQRDRVVRSVSD